MTLFEAAKTITALEAAERYAGIQAKRRGAKSWCRCPLPTHPADNTPSCSFDDKGRFYCFGCGAGGSSIDMVMKLFDITDREAALRIVTDFGIEHEDKPAARKPRPKVTPAQAREALTRFDTAAAGHLRFLKDMVSETQPDRDGDFSDRFMKALRERNTMQEVCDKLQGIMARDDLEAGLEMLAAYKADLHKWESVSASWKKEVEA